MELKDIASIAGKPGLFRVLKPTRTGVMVETLDEQKKRTVAGATARISVLQEVSMYTTDSEGYIALADVLYNIYQKHQLALPVHAKSDDEALFGFFADVVPDYDRDKVRSSDVKKLVSWYGILAQYAPELLASLGNETAANSADKAPEEEA
ncbi:DUF5606 domain-containing protein [Eisenibacter elegans]|jgi:hypothetical protein|uniref:DUF5606 family protein n=1 Tax=Eisenibacter elegans TaxID=997 RepID=UPI00041F5119|nr:DUF5606 domain-containing protein [Eisenibacter elegans]